LGLKSEDVVSILIGRGENMPITSLGAMKAGTAYQPLDSTYPTDRLAFMMEDAQTKLLIADEDLLELVSDYHGKILLTKDILELPAISEPLRYAPKPQDLMILLYTSGSTGTPKGCMLEHRNLVNFVHWYHKYFNLTEESRVIAYASFGFDANMMDTYPALSIGAQLHIISEEIRLNIPAMNEYFNTNKITHAFMTTQVGRAFALSTDADSLKYLLMGGEKLVPFEPINNCEIYNLYGPTECTILTSSFLMEKLYENVPIGKALGNTKLYVTDKYNRLLPVGVPGELCIAGHLVSRGYLKRPDLTAEKYINTPFTNESGYEKMYCSGDIVRYLPDGNIEFIGRRDGQVKIRGFRIELTEVEGILRQYKDIKDATVVTKDAPTGGKYIAAYIVSDQKIDNEALKDFIVDQKPPYMVPAAIMQIDKIPLNPNGKVDKRKLPEVTFTNTDSEEGSSRALTYMEEGLKDIVSGIVGSKDFSMTVNLMHVGLTSLSAIKLATEIDKAYGFTPDVKQLMKGCSILSIENEIQKYLLKGDRKVENHKDQEKKEYYALSQSQLGVYYDCMKRPLEMIYNIPVIFGLPDTAESHKLADAAKKVILAHPYIMTHLSMKGDEVVQLPNTRNIEIPIVTMTENQLIDYKKEFVQPFNLFKGALYRISVIKTEKGVYLLADFHHIIFDGGSVDIFLKDLKVAYEGKELICETYSCFDYVQEEVKSRNGDAFKEAKNFFDMKLKNFERSSELTPDLNGKTENGLLAESLYLMDNDNIEAFCKKNGITPAHLFLAATFYTISRYTNNKEVYISTISNGRTNLKIQNSLGMYVKTLALYAKIGNESVLEFVENTKKSLQDTISFEEYPFAEISAKYGFIPEIMYACQLGILSKVEIDGDTVSQEGLELKIPKFKTSVHIENRNGKIGVCVQYNDALYSKLLMDGFAQSIGSCVEHMMQTPNQSLKNISLLNKSELSKIKRFRESESYDLEEKLFHKVFQNQAHIFPTRNALIASDGEFTYEQLDILTNKLANGLISFGVKPGARVAILLNRSSRMIITMFGIMKAGCAYIPCDPEYPVERINHILEDSNAIYVVTTPDRINDFPEGKAIDAEKLLLCENTKEPVVKVLPTDLAYLIYTSGSTGKPKGVMLEHQGICNYVYNHRANIHVHTIANEATCMLSVTTMSFDMSLKEVAVALCNGLTLVLANEDEANNPILLAELFEKIHADVFNATPSRMLQYMELPALCKALTKCKVIMSGGEKYSEVLLHKLKEITKARIFNTYGPTEITVSSNAKELTHENSITIGKPLLNYKEFIVDSDQNEVPVAVVGELYIGGMGVARGYNNLEELTKKQFVTYQGIRVYKSGDYAKWTKDGDVVVLGRADSQVKLRGLRIELGEIESCITKQNGIKNAVVLIRKINETEHICAYFSAEHKVDIDLLKAELKKMLTAYMVPSAYLQLESLPLTPNGKIDIKSLPEPLLAVSKDYTAPRNKAEEDFCKIFSKTLGIQRVGILDDFFECGGTSLLVTKVTIEAMNCGYMNISYGDVFTASTPKLLAKKVSGEKLQEKTVNLQEFDYTKIDAMLTKNNLDSIRKGEYREIGNVLLTGATGFLGIHILKEYLDNYSGKVYCLIRKSRRNSLEGRVKNMLVYYFEEDFEELFGKRIFLIEGDVTSKKAFEKAKEYDINTVINCAANVKHFAKDGEIETVNVGGVKNAVDFAIEKKARLIQISTTSIAGYGIEGMPPIGTAVNEQQFYVGQKTDNEYVNSKFMAERILLEAISDNRLDGKIMRVGNLMARNRDGEFQANFANNSFVNRLRAYHKIGCISYGAMNVRTEFAPIDSTAQSILILASTPKECCVFHPYNNHEIYIGDVIHAMNQRGLSIKSVEADEFEEKFTKAMEDKNNVQALSGLVAYLNMGNGKPIVMISTTCNYTIEVLYRLGFKWPLTTDGYLDNFISMLDGLGFFDRE
jgi:amino acid adenylation domain-containing protein